MADMARLIYSMIGSLDGYVADPSGNFDWAEPDEEVLGFLNDQERGVGTYLYGRRIYELMKVWETDAELAAGSPGSNEFAKIWKAASKVVFSTRLESVSTARTELRHTFDPRFIRELKASAETDIGIAGPTLAGHAFRADLVDQFYLLVVPTIVGGGRSLFPRDLRVDLTLRGSRSFAGGMVALQYDVGRS